ncbi:hypothetical protein Tco_1547270 [Tanacetum coccineum]
MNPSAGSDRGLKRRKTRKDSEPTINPKKKDSTFGSSKGTQSEPRSSGKSVQSEEPVFEVVDFDMPQDQERNLGDNKDEPRKETASKSPSQTWLMNLAASNPFDKSLEDITKNIDIEYLPKRRWSTLEKKRAHFMIKDINKLLKERRMMRSLEKFVGGRLYGTDLRLLQRTI